MTRAAESRAASGWEGRPFTKETRSRAVRRSGSERTARPSGAARGRAPLGTLGRLHPFARPRALAGEAVELFEATRWSRSSPARSSLRRVQGRFRRSFAPEFPSSARVLAWLGPTDMLVLMRLMAFILLCIGIQIMWNGWAELNGIAH
jgi:hypothetical protein